MALTSQLEALSLANHDFSISLYKELSKTEEGNIFFSPFSIHMIMFMASIGAASNTFDEMMKTIHLNETTYSMEAYKNLLEELISENNTLKLANGMFVDSAFNIKDSFVENCNKYLKSSMEKLNFKKTPEQQRQYLNNWVLSKINNQIKDLFPRDSITVDTALVLANAVYFKSSWVHTFNETIDDSFYVTPSQNVSVKMMTLVDYLRYYYDAELKFAALELPYEHRSFKMIILLPNANDSLKDLENNISKIKLHEISKRMFQSRVTVKLPRFKLEQTLQLKDTLTNLGCPTMFSRAANFSNIVEGGNLHVSKILHKAFIDVNEKGTEAAAAAGMVIYLRSSKAKKGVQFFANRPFLFFITGKNNEVIFFGRVQNLSEN